MCNGFREKNKTFGIVRIIHALLLVESGPLIQAGLINEIRGDPGFRFQTPDLALKLLQAQRKLERQVDLLQSWKTFADAQVQRSHNSDPMASSREGFTQRTDHIRQASGLGVWMDFAAGQKDFHRVQNDPLTQSSPLSSPEESGEAKGLSFRSSDNSAGPA